MKNHVAVGTYQKTGTVWMANTFSELAERIGARYKNISRYKPELKINRVKSRQLGIVFDNHTDFPQEYGNLDVKGFRLIRDPRDMLISATKYHQKTDNKFANRPRREFGGKTLKEALLELDAFEDRLLFEIDHYAHKNIDPMTEFSDWDNFLTIRYEDLVLDQSMIITARLLTWLGFSEDEVLIGLNCFWRNSLFGQLNPASTGHISDGSVAQYRRVFTDGVENAFLNKFGTALEALGYLEASPRWKNKEFDEVKVSRVIVDLSDQYRSGQDEALRESAYMAIQLAPQSQAGYREMAFLENASGNMSSSRKWLRKADALA